MNSATTLLRRWVLTVISSQGAGPTVDYDQPLGDPGLFGPGSVTWKIHAEFPGMMSGGICALMLQTLHPLALAGVWDHSDFRNDILGRLRRTTSFVAATTYAPTESAYKLIHRVQVIHRRVYGAAQNGRPYSAEDPDLLTWVHCTEMWSFLQGYQRYRGIRLPVAIRDQYYDETRRIAEALGARNVPRNQAEIDCYFQQIQPELTFSSRSQHVLEVLRGMRLPVPAGTPAREMFLGAGAALLPAWARGLICPGRTRWLQDQTAARGLRALAPLFRTALRNGVAARSCRRTGVQPNLLNHWEDPANETQMSSKFTKP